MILDTISQASTYFPIHPAFEEAFRFIQSIQQTDWAEGRGVIGNELSYILAASAGKSKAEALQKFECHDQHIDIQVCLNGHEQIAWKHREDCKQPHGAYIPEKDVRYFTDEPSTFLNVHAGQFVIFFPSDVHAPLISAERIHKLVIKVKI